MNKHRKTSIWWSLLLIGIYLWMQVATSVVFAILIGIKNVIKTEQTGELFKYDLFMQEFTGNYMLIILLISALLSLTLCLLIYKWRKINVRTHMKWKSTQPRLLFLAVPTGLSVEFTAMLVFSLTAYLFKQSAEAYESMVAGMTKSGLAFVVIGFVAPVVEDILFRGLILNELRRDYSLTTAVILQAVLFGAMHLNIAQGFYAAFAGLILGLIAVEADSVFPAIIGHIVMNSSALILSYVNEEALTVLLVPLIGVSVLFLFVISRRAIKRIKMVKNQETYQFE